MTWTIRPNAWPMTDQALWQVLIATGDVLDEHGAGARWRSATRKFLSDSYGNWLRSLEAAGVDLDVEPPVERVTPARVRAYLAWLNGRAASTRAARLMALLLLMRRAAPARDWRWLQRVHSRLDAEARRERGTKKRLKIVASNKLLTAGLSHMEGALAEDGLSPRGRAVRFRDGLMIALLALRPLRIKNFAGLRLGYHVRQTPLGYLIDLPGAETKNGRPFETMLPDELIVGFEDYLTVHRPALLGAVVEDHLWIARTGRAVEPKKLSDRISTVTRRLIGHAVSPHCFRDCAATTLSIADPEHVRAVTPLLGHSTPRTAETYYNQARSLEAGRAHRKNIRQLQNNLRQCDTL
jgi:integrase/recombinase XerD